MDTDKARSTGFLILYAVVLLVTPVWLQLAYVRERVAENLPLAYGLYAFAVCYLGLRAYLVLGRRVRPSWDYAWLALDLALISAAVGLTGGMRSEAALLYFWPLATSAIQHRMRRTLVVGLLSAALYLSVAAPTAIRPNDPGKLGAHIFVLLVATALATSYARTEGHRVEEMASLREKVALGDYRTRLSREMHDGIQHYLVNIATRLELANFLVEKDPAQAVRMATDQRLAVRQASDELRYLVRRLRSPVIEQQGFVDALKDHLAMVEERTGVPAPLEIEGTATPLSADIEQAAFRIVQEALTNAEKHAEASGLKVRLTFGGEVFECVTADDGAGFDPAEAPKDAGMAGGFGLGSMRQRAESAGGRLEIASSPGEGTTVTFTVPLSDHDAAPVEDA